MHHSLTTAEKVDLVVFGIESSLDRMAEGLRLIEQSAAEKDEAIAHLEQSMREKDDIIQAQYVELASTRTRLDQAVEMLKEMQTQLDERKSV